MTRTSTSVRGYNGFTSWQSPRTYDTEGLGWGVAEHAAATAAAAAAAVQQQQQQQAAAAAAAAATATAAVAAAAATTAVEAAVARVIRLDLELNVKQDSTSYTSTAVATECMFGIMRV